MNERLKSISGAFTDFVKTEINDKGNLYENVNEIIDRHVDG